MRAGIQSMDMYSPWKVKKRANFSPKYSLRRGRG
jgi:hypothetical protein